jgi:hypothetical protein
MRVVNQNLLTIIEVINSVHIFIDSRQRKQCYLESCCYLISCFEFTGNSSWDPNGLYINMRVEWPSRRSRISCLFPLREGLGFWNAKMEGIVNWTKIQISLFWLEESQVSIHYNTTRCLTLQQLEWFYWLPLQRIGHRCTWIHSPETLPPPPTPHLERHKV